MADAFRVLKITKIGFKSDSEPTTDVIWEGTDLDELSTRFPRSDVMFADELGHHEIEDGWIQWDSHFEMRSGDGEWQKVAVPRHKVYDPEQKELEAAIDAENRRLFPGDYEDSCDEEYYDDY